MQALKDWILILIHAWMIFPVLLLFIAIVVLMVRKNKTPLT